jgi:hypothetical protein
MGAVAIHDPEGDRLIRLAESLGEANLSEGERWRLANTLDRRRRLEAQANAPSGRTDALDAQVLERRFSVLENHARWAAEMIRDGLPQVVGEVIAEAEERAITEAKKLVGALRDETTQKAEAHFSGFESAVRELRDTDRATILSDLRETMSSAESRIDEHLETALTKTWERAELEIALVRDELLGVISEKQYGRLADDDAAKHVMAEKAIASLRKQVTALEEQAARGDQLAGVANRLAALEDAHHKARKGLVVRAATTAVLLKKETARADELAAKVAALESMLEELISVLRENKALR